MTVLIAGETALLRDALTELLQAQPDICVLGQTAGEHETLRKAAALEPHVVLMEPWAKWSAVIRTVRTLRRLSPCSAVLALPSRNAVVDRQALEAAGLRNYLPRDAGWTALLAAVRSLAPAAVQDAVKRPVPALSRRETEVLRGVATAMTNQQIASGLGITTGTVKRHLHAAFRKLDAVSRLDAVTQAVAAGLLIPPAPGSACGAETLDVG
ncbi:response regulator transcription factor [Streptomyces pinistramenti]|uniref:response regulator transcription factor n=1 Tax=Streptomyces pinistramenti TaxID=2884812 RepID=UPI001D07F8B1|nr:response regulator transcription factor [Streptomyces pinistramenti]MCB5912288.1 response regulator transcription factor [Streptomyces pinistramenti]